MPRRVQSENMPIQTAIGPAPKTRIRTVVRTTLQPHMTMLPITMEYRTSPAARSPYPGIKARTHTIGLTAEIQPIMKIHMEAASGSIPARKVIGRTQK